MKRPNDERVLFIWVTDHPRSSAFDLGSVCSRLADNMPFPFTVTKGREVIFRQEGDTIVVVLRDPSNLNCTISLNETG